MKVRLYTIHDKVALESGPIFQTKNGSVARRQFVNMMKSENVYNPEDYQLLEVGVYDTDTSVIDAHEVPELIMAGYKAMSIKNDEVVEDE